MLFLTDAGYYNKPLLPQQFCAYLGKTEPAWKMAFVTFEGIK